MSATRVAALVVWWVRRYTRGLAPSVAERRREEIAADVHDHLAAGQAAGVGERRLAVAVLSRMLRGLPADAAWRRHQTRLAAQRADTQEATVVVDRSLYRRAVAVAVGAVLLLVWMIGALGIIGDEGDGADALYLGVLAVAAVGALLARLRPEGMARALLATALAQATVTAIALAAGLVPSYNPAAEILALNGFFIALFSTSAWLFHRAGQAPPPPTD